MKKFFETVNAQIPFELKRPFSLISIILALIITGFFMQFGIKLFDLVFQITNPYIPMIIMTFIDVVTYSVYIKINLITAFFSLIFYFYVYRKIEKLIIERLKYQVVFEDDFNFGNKGWNLNYWGSNNPDKTCRYEDSYIIFEAAEEDLIDSRKEYGAYFDLSTGIYKDSKYEVSCWIKSEGGTSMGFKLWVHDTQQRSERKYPASFYTPGESLEEVKVGFVGTDSQGLRVHLHIKAGRGKILVDKVKVVKVK